MSDQDTIRQRAFELWVAEGRPHGRDIDHWLRAEAELVPPVSSRRTEPASKRQSGSKKVAAKTEAGDKKGLPAKKKPSAKTAAVKEAGTKTKKKASKEQPAKASAKRSKTLAKA